MVLEMAAGGLCGLCGRIAGRFALAEPCARVRRYVSGLVAGLEWKSGWTLAEQAGEVSPDGMQRLLRRADWDVGGVRDDVRGYVIEQLGDPGVVLIADETGFVKKGTARTESGLALNASLTAAGRADRLGLTAKSAFLCRLCGVGRVFLLSTGRPLMRR